jgi:methionyl-tRNA formyltransferase
MRIALCFQDGNFVGREYFARLVEAGHAPDLVLAVGRMKPESVARERERTGGLWNPPAIPDGAIAHRFESASDPGFAARLRAEAIDVAIQGGIAILKDEALAAPLLGWVNVHPGRLPAYRGNACPEWALLNGDPVVATAHLIDAGIDTGPVICARAYEIEYGWDYAAFRAGLYRHCAAVLVDALDRLEREGLAAAAPQPPEGAVYRPPLTPAQAGAVRNLFPLPRTRSAS